MDLIKDNFASKSDSAILFVMDTIFKPISKPLFYKTELILPVIAFAIPFLVSGPQLVTGTLINAFLFYASLKLSKKALTGIIIGPSIGALFNGLVFGVFTPFLAYFLPFIWIGNYILAKTFNNNPTFAGVVKAAFFKSAFLFAFAFLFNKLSIVPEIFLTAMGVFQFVTAILGGSVFILINRLSQQPTLTGAVNRGKLI